MNQRIYWCWKRGQGGQLSPNFHAREFECACGVCDEQRIHRELIGKLEELRGHIKGGVIVTEGFRCNAYQARLKAEGYQTAAGISQHEYGHAADIKPADSKKKKAMFMKAKEIFMAIGEGKTWMHVDLRADKKRLWKYTG